MTDNNDSLTTVETLYVLQVLSNYSNNAHAKVKRIGQDFGEQCVAGAIDEDQLSQIVDLIGVTKNCAGIILKLENSLPLEYKLDNVRATARDLLDSAIALWDELDIESTATVMTSEDNWRVVNS